MLGRPRYRSRLGPGGYILQTRATVVHSYAGRPPKRLSLQVSLWNLYSISECHDVSCVDLLTRSNEGRKYCTVGLLLPEVTAVLLDENSKRASAGRRAKLFGSPPHLFLSATTLGAPRLLTLPSL